jgi:type IV pilus assembly protein PilQ
MSRVIMLVAAGALALSAAYADGPMTLAAHSAPAERDAAEGVVKSLSVLPATGHAVVVIGVEGAVDFQDFTLRSPDKIVVDISGVSLGMPQAGYDRIERGGIVDVRYSQYRRNVVRVVLTLDRSRSYSVSTTDRQIRIAVSGDSAQTFTAWHTVAEAAPSVASARQQRETAGERYQPEVVSAGDPMPRTPVFEASAPPPAGRAPLQQRSQQPRISVAWQNANIRDVVAAFAGFSGRTIIVASTVPNTAVNAEIYDQPWDVAMAAILSAHGLAATEDPSGIIIVDTFQNIAARQAVERLETRTIRLNYSRAGAVAASVRERLSRDCPPGPGTSFSAAGGEPLPPTTTAPVGGETRCPARGTVTVDTLTNAISITDVPSNLEFLEQYARSLDVRQPQVAIKAKIILVDRTNLEALGLKYDIGTRQQFFNDLVPRLDSLGRPFSGPGQILLGGNTLSAIANASAQIPSAALRLVYSTALGNFDFTTFLEALQEVSLLDVQSEPSIVTLNNRTATLRAGTEVPIRVIEQGAGAGGPEGNFPRATVTMRQTGIVLNVTPTITANRQVQMVVHAENSDVDFRGGDVGAVFPTQAVSNELLVADGETAVMGGLTQTRVSISRSGIPILVDLPLIGRLFGVHSRLETKRDLLILITPHIVDEGQLVPDSVLRD